MMAARIRERVLAEKMDAMRRVKNLAARALEKVELLVRDGSDAELFRVNPLRFAADRGLMEHDVIDVFLHGARNGLFQMEWNLVCPSCGDSVDSFRSLNKVNTHFYCAMCDLNSEATLDDYIQVTFTVSPEVRDIAYHHPESLSVEEYHLKYHFNPGASLPGGPRFIDAMPSMVKGLSYIGPGQKKRFDMDTAGGSITLNDLVHHLSAVVAVKGDPSDKPQALTVRQESGKLVADRAELAPGRIVITVDNRTAARASMLILGIPPGFEKKHLVFEPFLSGKRLISLQTFRELFSSEVVQGTEGIGVRDITILFTDLKGSTALYERIGDLKAFSLVHQHFDKLGRVIGENSGAFVKTIGDAVMASFLTPLDAMKAALEMNREINRFNRAFTSRDVILKVGIHRGPCIAVTLNDRLDYFGQTVNTAARVQRLAGAEEVYVTEEVLSFPGVKTLLRGSRVFGGKVRLKGIQDEVQVYKIVPPDFGNGRDSAGPEPHAAGTGLMASAGAAASNGGAAAGASDGGAAEARQS
jgi:class 3 adenylate cyclase